MKQNTSHAVMAQASRQLTAPTTSPTPPWATRALLEHVLESKPELANQSCLELACGGGHIAVGTCDAQHNSLAEGEKCEQPTLK